MKNWIDLNPVSLNQGQRIRIPIGKRFDGKTLAYMLAQFKKGPFVEWLEEGRFRRNQIVLKGVTALSAGDVISFSKPPWKEPNVPEQTSVIFEDESLIVIEKPEGIPVTPSGEFYENSLVHLLRKHSSLTEVSPIHRLDLETSGVLAFAKKPDGRSFFQKQFTNSTVRKVYIALVFGLLPKTSVILTDYLKKAREGPIFSKWISGTENNRLCRTRILDSQHIELNRHQFTTVFLQPLSGRTNQIRAQLATHGHSIVGDKKYFHDERIYLDWIKKRDWLTISDQLLLPSLALHAVELVLNLPNQKEPISLKSGRDRAKEWIAKIKKNCDKAEPQAYGESRAY